MNKLKLIYVIILDVECVKVPSELACLQLHVLIEAFQLYIRFCHIANCSVFLDLMCLLLAASLSTTAEILPPPVPRSLTNEDTLSNQAAAAPSLLPHQALHSSHNKTNHTRRPPWRRFGWISAVDLVSFFNYYYYLRDFFFTAVNPAPLYTSALSCFPSLTQISHSQALPQHLYLSSSSPSPSFLHSFTPPPPSSSSSFLSFGSWIRSLFTLPDHSTDSHPWNDAIKVPTGAQSVMLTHAKPPQRAQSSTECWPTGKSDGGEGWRLKKKGGVGGGRSFMSWTAEETKCSRQDSTDLWSQRRMTRGSCQNVHLVSPDGKKE